MEIKNYKHKGMPYHVHTEVSPSAAMARQHTWSDLACQGQTY
jgi:hypothetical protein